MIMLDAKNLLASIDSSGLVGKMLGGMATKNFAAGLLTGGVATSLLGGGKDTLETAAKAGGLALLGTLAYQAFGNYQQQKAAGGNASAVDAVKQSATNMASQASGLLAGFMAGQQAPAAAATTSPANADLSLAVIRAMIGAAKADGHMDAVESQKIMGQLESAGATAQEKALLMQEFANVQDVQVIAKAATTAQDGAQIYLAALLVCDSQCANEQVYLSSLAGALKLEPAFTASLQQHLLNLSTSKAA
jgi:uncharacterized membrane protein YebE (DUF533 family)